MFMSNRLRSAVLFGVMIGFGHGPASAQDGGTLSITGTFKMSQVYGGVGDDLAAVFANGYDHWWKLTLNGVSYSHDYYFAPESWGYTEEFRTRVHATSFTFEFFGPDAAILNEVVGSHLVQGGVPDGGVLELVNGEDSYEGTYMTWVLRLYPPDPDAGFYFVTSPFGWFTGAQFPADELGYPLVQPQRLSWADSLIWYVHDGIAGALVSNSDIMDIGSDQPPVLPPPQISIDDASIFEGRRGAATLYMRVTLYSASTATVTVNYQTADGTAVAASDYGSASGALTFQPGETVKTIAISIKGDRKREPNETFRVQLSNAVGANLGRSVGVATILNDD
jgi:hypothetical protein